MRLTSLSVLNFKGETFTQDLATVTVIVGDNWTGKTTRTDAIRILLVGYLPEIGKAAKENFLKLSSGREMAVSGVFDDGSKIIRKWWVTGDTVKSTAIVPPALEQYAGLTVMLNASSYFELSDQKRIDYVTENIPMAAEEYSPPIVQEKIRSALLVPEMELGGDDVTAFLVSLDNDCRKKTFQTPQEFIAVATEAAKDLAKKASDFKDRMQQTIQGLAYLRTQDQTGGSSIASIEDQIGGLTREITALTEKKGVFIGSYSAIVATRERRKYLKKEIESGAKSISDIATINAELARLKDELSLITIPGLEALGALLVEKANVTQKINSLTVEWNGYSEAIAKAEKNLDELDSQTVCPYCGATGENWKKIRAAELALQVEEFTGKRDGLATAAGDSRRKLSDVVADHSHQSSMQTKGDTLNREIRTAEANLAEARKVADRIAVRKSEFDQLAPEDPLLQQQVEDVQSSLNVKEESLRSLREVHRKAMARAGDLQRLGECEKNRDEATVEHTVAKAAIGVIRDIQEKMVKDAFVPLIKIANELFGDMFRSPLDYHQGDVGTWRAGRWFTHTTFSGIEKALTYAAIQIALSARSPYGIMILDEMGRISDDKIRRVYFRINCAIEKKSIAQFIGIDAGRGSLHLLALGVMEDTTTAPDFTTNLVTLDQRDE